MAFLPRDHCQAGMRPDQGMAGPHASRRASDQAAIRVMSSTDPVQSMTIAIRCTTSIPCSMVSGQLETDH